MARTPIPITQLTASGVELPAATAGNSSEGNSLAETDGTIILEVTNADASATHAFTIKATGSVGAYPAADEVITVGKSKTVLVSGLSPQAVKQPTGLVNIEATSAELKFRAFRH